MRKSPLAFALFASTASAGVQDKDKLLALGRGMFLSCQSCHYVGDAKLVKLGPHLNDLFGRKPGTTPRCARGFRPSTATVRSFSSLRSGRHCWAHTDRRRSASCGPFISGSASC
jgi:cytochrome c2